MGYKFLVFMLGLLLLLPVSAQATGVGFSVGGHSSAIDLDVNDDGYWEDEDTFSAIRGSFGLLVDTNPTGYSVFNYRLNVDIRSVVLEDDDWSTFEFEGYGFEMKHTFGFGLARARAFRLWMGPSLRYYFDYASLDGWEDTYEMYAWAFGLGPELGMNVAPAPGMALTVSIGYSYLAGYMDLDYPNSHWNVQSTDGSTIESMAYIQLGMLFGRMW